MNVNQRNYASIFVLIVLFIVIVLIIARLHSNDDKLAGILSSIALVIGAVSLLCVDKSFRQTDQTLKMTKR